MTHSSLARLQTLRFRNLRLLQLIVEHGSLRRAANDLHITQPAASAMLQEIETVFGMSLFVRTRSGMLPTKNVQILLQRITVLENELLGLHEDAHALRTRSHQVYRLGVIPRSMPVLMPKVLSKLTDQHPGLEFRLIEATSDVLFDGLSRNEFDSILARPTRELAKQQHKNGFEFQPLYEEGMFIVTGKEHPLASQHNLTLKDTLPWKWVLPPIGSVTRNLLIDQFLLAGIRPPVPIIESSGFLANLGFVEGGGLLTAAPESAVKKYGDMHGIRILDLKLTVPLPQIALIWRAHLPIQGPLALLRNALLAENTMLTSLL